MQGWRRTASTANRSPKSHKKVAHIHSRRGYNLTALLIPFAALENWRAKKPYSASFACLEYSDCWKPWSALVGLIWSVHLLGTQRVRKQRWNLWKLTFVWISSFERWNHWRKNRAKVIQRKCKFPYGHSMSATGMRKSMKSRISNDFATWALKSLKNFFVKKLSTVNSTTAAWTDHQRIPKFLKIRNDQKLTFIKISHNDCWNHWRFFQWKSYPQPVQFALL